jgi:hypothetical protein
MRVLQLEDVKKIGGAEFQEMGDFVLHTSVAPRIYELPDGFDLIEMLYKRIFNPVDAAADAEAAQIEEYKRQGKIIIEMPI